MSWDCDLDRAELRVLRQVRQSSDPYTPCIHSGEWSGIFCYEKQLEQTGRALWHALWPNNQSSTFTRNAQLWCWLWMDGSMTPGGYQPTLELKLHDIWSWGWKGKREWAIWCELLTFSDKLIFSWANKI